MRIVFMGTPQFAVPTLGRLLQTQLQVVAVYTQPDRPAGRGRELSPSPIKRVALQHGLTVVQPTRLRRPEAIAELASFSPDVIVVCAFGQILSQAVLDIPPHGSLNVHPSLLPKHRGASPIAGAILAGEEETGVTIMLMDVGMDTGPILTQVRVPIDPEDTTGTLSERLAAISADLLVSSLEDWLEGRLTPTPQDNSRATYTKPIEKEQGELDWRLSAMQLWRVVRAFNPWPGSYTHWRGPTLKVLQAKPLAGAPGGELGEVLALAPRPESREKDPSHPVVGVQTAEGVLGLVRVQLEGKKPMMASEFVRGHRDFIGFVLPSPSGAG